MTTVQIALAAGALIGLGVSLLVWRMVPAHPGLASALDRLAPERSLSAAVPVQQGTSARDRTGLWMMRNLPVAQWGLTPTRELVILRVPLHRFYGEKVMFALVGLVIPPLLSLAPMMFGLYPPLAIPLIASLALALALSFLPEYNARSDASLARMEFARALSAYVDLVALERNAGSGPRQAMEAAATVGDSWAFRRVSEELARSRLSGVPPWDALSQLSEELGVPELAEVADIMRMSGEEGAAVYKTLRARSSSMRAAMLNNELAKANAAGERLSMPVSALGLVFLALLAAPALLRILLPGL